MTAPASKSPPFFCPRCGQKHRADLGPLAARPGAVLRTPCRRCRAPLTVRLEDGEPRCEASGEAVVEAPPSAPADAAAEDRELSEGERADRYTIHGVARRGATSTVYRAYDPKTKRGVAMKVLRSDAAPPVKERFLRQIEVQANIRHQSIMPVYDQGTLEDGRPFFTMEMLHDAASLDDLVTRRLDGTLQSDARLAPLTDLGTFVERVLIPVAEGIYVANIENGVLHGDLRPGNVLIDGHTGRPYVTDFGYAEPTGDALRRAQMAHVLSPFLPPELARGRIHPRTDVWGLGALLHLALAGTPPLDGAGEELRRAAEAGRTRALPDEAPPPLAAVARKAMAYDPDLRYVNARQLGADLRSWRKGGWVRAVDEFGGTEAARVETRAAIRRQLKSGLWVGAGLLVGLLVGSQVEIGGDDGAGPRVESVFAAANRFEQELDGLAEAVNGLTVREQARVFQALEARVDATSRRLETLPSTQGRRAAEERLGFVRARFAPTEIEIRGPEGLQLKATNRATAREYAVTPGRLRLPPGPYDVRDARGGSFRFPAVVPWVIRTKVRSPESTSPPVPWIIPDAAQSAPAGTALVLGGRLATRRLPYAPPADALSVGAFHLDRRPVTHEEYLRFLIALPDAAARRVRVPPDGFTLDDAAGRVSVDDGREKEPVRGVSAEDTAAYCAWRSRAEDAIVRLPTEVEWMLAAGGAEMVPGSGDLGPPTPDNARGVFGLLQHPVEIVRSSVEREGHLLKGPTEESDDAQDAVYRVRPVDGDDRSAQAGFRCVREIASGD